MRRLVALIALAGLLAGCGNLFGSNEVRQMLSDPSGDAVGTGTRYDVTGITSVATSSQVTIDITFVQAVLLPPASDSALSTEFAGLIDFDTDQNGATGLPSCKQGVGAERFVDMTGVRNADGTYPVKNTSSVVVGAASASTNGTVLTVALSTSLLGDSDRRFNLGVAAGNGSGPTDCAPNQTTLATTRWRGR